MYTIIWEVCCITYCDFTCATHKAAHINGTDHCAIKCWTPLLSAYCGPQVYTYTNAYIGHLE
jgi:hypothetical protein